MALSLRLCGICYNLTLHGTHLSHDGRGPGFDIDLNSLRISADSGCKACLMLYHGFKIFQNLTPDFQANYRKDQLDSLFLQRNDCGSLRVVLQDYGQVQIDIWEFYTQRSCPWPYVSYANELPERMTIQIATRKIKKWLSQCDTHHPTCDESSRKDMQLPTRVLCLDMHKVSLHVTKGKRGGYATLIHCWGSSQVLTTTEETLEERMSCIRWSQLPPLFQDAINLTKALGIRYLWIDSLCILQGHQLDWQRESETMDTVFSNSYLNFAATLSGGSQGTLFTQRWTTPLQYAANIEDLPKRPVKSYPIGNQDQKVKINCRYSVSSAHDHIRLLRNDDDSHTSDLLQKAPLMTRGWVFQERLLSPRTVHFHTSELIWECKEFYDCECGDLRAGEPYNHNGQTSIGKRLLSNIDMLLPTLDVFIQWMNYVQEYSRLKLSHGEDKLPALSGLAKYFAGKTMSVYLAGMWRDDLPRSLCWRVKNFAADNFLTQGRRYTPYRAPSWSWVSVELVDSEHDPFAACICYDFIYGHEFISDTRFKILEAKCVAAASSPYGQVMNGKLRAKGALMPISLMYAVQDYEKVCWASFGSITELVHLDRELESVDFGDLMEDHTVSEGKNLWGLVLGRVMRHERNDLSFEQKHIILLLEISDPAVRTYERVGIVQFPLSNTGLMAAEVTYVEII